MPALPSTTTISGGHSGYTEVELTEPLRAFDEDAPEITFEGGGEVIGIALRSPPDAMGYSSPAFDVYSVGVGELRGFADYDEHDGTLPPGRYRLYLIAERPGSATIEFPKLEPGQLSVQPDVETPQRSGRMSTRTSGDVVKFSEHVTLWGGGVIFMKAFPTPGISTQLELCSYWPWQEAEAGERAYDPGCPDGFSSYKRFAFSEGDGAFSLSSPSSHWAEGLGGNVTSLIGSPGPVDTYLFSAGYELGPPPAWTDPWDEGTGDDDPSTQPSDPSLPGSESQPTQTGPVGERPCDGGGCQSEWGVATLSSRRARLVRRRIRVPLICDGGWPCRGQVGLVRRRAKSFAFGPGERGAIAVRVPSGLRRRVRRDGRARARIAVTSRLNDEQLQFYRRIVIRRRR